MKQFYLAKDGQEAQNLCSFLRAEGIEANVRADRDALSPELAPAVFVNESDFVAATELLEDYENDKGSVDSPQAPATHNYQPRKRHLWAQVVVILAGGHYWLAQQCFFTNQCTTSGRSRPASACAFRHRLPSRPTQLSVRRLNAQATDANRTANKLAVAPATPGKSKRGGSSFHWSRQPASRAESLPQARSLGHKTASAGRADQLFILVDGIMGGMASEVLRNDHVFRRLSMPTRTRARHPTARAWQGKHWQSQWHPNCVASHFRQSLGRVAERIESHVHLVHHREIQPAHLPVGLVVVIQHSAAADLAAATGARGTACLPRTAPPHRHSAGLDAVQ